jgi:hypothetical protein
MSQPSNCYFKKIIRNVQTMCMSCAQALGSGVLSKEKADMLAEVRDKMGLSKEAAEKIIKGVQNQHLISGLQACPFTHTPCFGKPKRALRYGLQCFECTGKGTSSAVSSRWSSLVGHQAHCADVVFC